MGTLVTVLIFIVAILLGIIVLVQNPKGGGLGSGFGNVNQLGGVKRTADFLEKATWGLAIALVVLCLASSGIVASERGGGYINEDFEGEAEMYEMTAPVVDPGAGLDDGTTETP